MTLLTTPQQDNFYMPGECVPHTRCWMLWPTRPDVWRENAQPAQKTFAQVAQAIAQFEPVTVGVQADAYTSARTQLPNHIDVVPVPYNDCWTRDNGPTFLLNDKTKELRGVHWDFNAWGGLYADVSQDKLTASHILQLAQAAEYNCPIVLEGGSIDCDGQGTVLVTKECLLHPNRNPTLSQSEIETYLQRYLNIETVVWLDRGVYEDETDGHVDNLVCFAQPGEVVLLWTENQDDPQYDISREAYEALRMATDARGRPFKVHKIHQPDLMLTTAEEASGVQIEDGTFGRPAGERLSASYVNYYMANGGIVMPLFGQEKWDTAAQQQLQEIYPHRKVVGVYSREILLGGGNIHCITQQQPKPKLD